MRTRSHALLRLGQTISVVRVDAISAPSSNGVMMRTRRAYKSRFLPGPRDPARFRSVSPGSSAPLDPSPSEFMEHALTAADPAPGPDGFRMLQAQMNHVRSRGRRTGSFSLRQVHRARQRHRIPKAALVDTLFKTLDTRNTGVWGREELTNFALLTGHQGELDDVFVEVSHMLEDFGSSSTPSGSKALSLQDLASIVSRTGVLPFSKAELRRTIRYGEAPERQGPLVRSGPGSWRSINQMNIFIAAARWKERVCWHRTSSPWVLIPHRQCTDPDFPLKTHPCLFRRVEEA